jgi:outer membrane cobalamin receptor
VHARAGWRASPAVRLDFEVRNLFDTAYEDMRGYAAPGRELLLGMRFTPERGTK